MPGLDGGFAARLLWMGAALKPCSEEQDAIEASRFAGSAILESNAASVREERAVWASAQICGEVIRKTDSAASSQGLLWNAWHLAGIILTEILY